MSTNGASFVLIREIKMGPMLQRPVSIRLNDIWHLGRVEISCTVFFLSDLKWFVGQFLCSYSTLPMYALDTQIEEFCGSVMIHRRVLSRKYEETTAPRVEDSCFITDGTYTRKEVVLKENSVKEKKIKWCYEENLCGNFIKRKTKGCRRGPKQEYIHVRARRGQATDSHSLAERMFEVPAVAYSAEVANSAYFQVNSLLEMGNNPIDAMLRRSIGGPVLIPETLVVSSCFNQMQPGMTWDGNTGCNYCYCCDWAI
ncbi:putative basic helix-loop-helix leucine zipper transcription factor [Helianthus annuus]|nr:putative basic helix-loop-helix leucine zipper transcription factor [Helianthus annuus]